MPGCQGTDLASHIDIDDVALLDIDTTPSPTVHPAPHTTMHHDPIIIDSPVQLLVSPLVSISA